MDPEQTLSDLTEALWDNDGETARTAANDLFNWLHNGGFCPKVSREQLVELIVFIQKKLDED